MQPNEVPSPNNARSSLLLETLAEMVRPRSFPFPIARVQVGQVGRDGWGFTVAGGDSLDNIPLVTNGEVDVAILNPSAILTAAYRGTGPFSEPQPLRAITVIPSLDWMVFAVTEATGLSSIEDIKNRRYPLRVSIRGPHANVTQVYIREVLKATGFTLEDLVSWGGSISYDPYLPFQPERNGKVKSGEIDAIFDEGVTRFIPMLGDLGMRLLAFGEPLLERMDAIGLHRATIPRQRFPTLTEDVPALCFSGWPLYTREAAPDSLIYEFCRALDARKANVRWQQGGPLPLAEMCRDTVAGPLRIPLHPAAERYWREAGYL